MQHLQQRQRNRQAGLGVDRAAPIHPPIAQLAAEGIAQHLLDADCIHMHIQCGPALAGSTPDAIHIWPARQHILDIHFTAKIAKPASYCLGHPRFTWLAGARPACSGVTLGMLTRRWSQVARCSSVVVIIVS